MSLPLTYEHLNYANSVVDPSTIQVAGSTMARFFRRHLFEKLISVYKWKFPDTWTAGRAENYLLYTLYFMGFIGVVNSSIGAVPQHGTISGRNRFYQPSKFIVANPNFKEVNGQYNIGIDCELLQLTPDYFGLYDIVSVYANRMALADRTGAVNLSNSLLSYVFFGRNKNVAESFKKMFDELQAGNPAVVIDNKMRREMDGEPWELLNQNVSQNFIAPEIQALLEEYERDFDSYIGLPNNEQNQKKERLIVDEVNMNNQATCARAELWLETLQKSCERINKMFFDGGKELWVEWRNNPYIPDKAERKAENE